MTLQGQYNLIKEGKGSKYIFLNEAKKQFSHMITNPMGFDEVSLILKNRGVISENYIDLQPISNMEATPKASYEVKFAKFLAEEAKAIEKTTTKEVDEVNAHGFDTKDKSNLDNQIGQEVLNGIYFEAKQNPDKDLEEIRKMVSKNLEKDGQYYMKNAAFGVKGLGYQEKEIEEVSGAYKSSGYSDKLKKMVKESLITEAKSFEFAIDYNTGDDDVSYIEDILTDAGVNAMVKYGTLEDEIIIKVKNAAELSKAKKVIKANNFEINESVVTEAKKPKKETVDSKLAEIDKQGQIVALEAKMDTIDEMIESKNERLSMVSEDENLSELMDKQAIKGMQREIKLLQKRKAKMEKMYEKMSGKSYKKEEVVDEEMVNGVEVEEVSLDDE